MRKGIFIPPSVVRLMVIGAVALVGYAAKRELPDLRRYIKFETM